MPKMIQIRNVPDSVHRKLKSRAALQGMTLSDYLKRELQHIAEAPTLDEILEWAQNQPPIHLSRPVEDLVREDRDTHY